MSDGVYGLGFELLEAEGRTERIQTCVIMHTSPALSCLQEQKQHKHE